MTNTDPASNEAVLHELMPLVETSLDRHLGATSEWFPHDYVPYEQGRNFVEEPWQPSDSRLPDIAQTALEINLLTEDNLPYYHLALWRTFGDEEAWGEWVRRWTAEEGRHAIVIRDYLTVTRGLRPRRARARPHGPGRPRLVSGVRPAGSAGRRRVHDAAGAGDPDLASQHGGHHRRRDRG